MCQRLDLPLFPLNCVLFPNELLPLHIFEERYKLMINNCLDGVPEFGVVLIKSGSEVGGQADPHLVGTVARIRQTEGLDDGRMMIVVEGKQRFYVNRLTGVEPYLKADVELLMDVDDTTGDEASIQDIREVATRHLRMVMGLQGEWVKEAPAPNDPIALSYYLPSQLQVPLQQKQSLLEEPSTVVRLGQAVVLMIGETRGLKQRLDQEIGKRHSS